MKVDPVGSPGLDLVSRTGEADGVPPEKKGQYRSFICTVVDSPRNRLFCLEV